VEAWRHLGRVILEKQEAGELIGPKGGHPKNGVSGNTVQPLEFYKLTKNDSRKARWIWGLIGSM
jgi:hypothetical protein